ncbi:FAD-binding oxidoreductase [Xanthomonas sp. NCPPB 2654]|uniref:FAD-binding oxidoreductase n=1 Tax=unclassified Xanthomonas TaxID=2643310 RepID=UPI0021DFD6D4|nr:MULTISPECIES: FAD-binding oxidoreductase [unclassified Xanthomonas]MDL5365483.1 FAD-binding oxidoreductase [Xanthomonas sp. NCPPB 2654]UYC19174.1 FAD-binding oxidoreductase [Xanthomonas sp. CFBP 8443]
MSSSSLLRHAQRGERLLNDVHSRLNATPVRLLAPATQAEAVAMVRACAHAGRSLIAAGARHAMGGQQFLTHGCVLDTSALDRVLAFDAERGLLTVEAGIRWPALLAWLRQHPGNARGWTIRQKQTGADDFSLGGAFAANVHGRGLRYAPFVEDVEAVTLIDASGRLVHASRHAQPQLFALAAGGYGLFGLVVRLTLRLTPRRVLQRRVRLQRVGGLPQAFAQAIADGACYGDFQFAIDPASADFLDLGVLSCYYPAPAAAVAAPVQLQADDFARLLGLAHTAPSRAFDEYANFYLATDGQHYHCDTQQSGVYLDDYHAAVDRSLGHRGSDMITELYVPRACLPGFMARAADSLRRCAAHPVYGTVRLIEPDPTSVLCWARENWACIVFNLHVAHDPAGLAQAADAFRALIDDALHFGGSYYLTYHRWATAAQLQAAHPRIDAFLAAQREFDPRGLWRSDWYRHIAAARR